MLVMSSVALIANNGWCSENVAEKPEVTGQSEAESHGGKPVEERVDRVTLVPHRRKGKDDTDSYKLVAATTAKALNNLTGIFAEGIGYMVKYTKNVEEQFKRFGFLEIGGKKILVPIGSVSGQCSGSDYRALDPSFLGDVAAFYKSVSN